MSSLQSDTSQSDNPIPISVVSYHYHEQAFQSERGEMKKNWSITIHSVWGISLLEVKMKKIYHSESRIPHKQSHLQWICVLLLVEVKAPVTETLCIRGKVLLMVNWNNFWNLRARENGRHEITLVHHFLPVEILYWCGCSAKMFFSQIWTMCFDCNLITGLLAVVNVFHCGWL